MASLSRSLDLALPAEHCVEPRAGNEKLLVVGSNALLASTLATPLLGNREIAELSGPQIHAISILAIKPIF